MPTGYTSGIASGIDFKTFAMNCARAFGACIDLRDTPGGGEAIPAKFEPSSYHANAVNAARAELAGLDAMTAAQLDRAAASAWDDAETRRLMALDERNKLRAAYLAMLRKAVSWVPPTSEHAALRQFMCEQIQSSIDFDCATDYYEKPTERQTGVEWGASRRKQLNRDVAYHEREHAEEVSRTKERTEWVRALRAAL